MKHIPKEISDGQMDSNFFMLDIEQETQTESDEGRDKVEMSLSML